MGPKPMKLLKSNQNYAEFLLSIQLLKDDLLEGKTILKDEMREHFEHFYSSLSAKQLNGYMQWLNDNRFKISRDIHKVVNHGVDVIIAPENEKKQIQFQKYVDAVKEVCDSPADFHNTVTKRVTEVAMAMYSPAQADRKKMTIRNYLRKNYRALNVAVIEQMSGGKK